MRIVKYTISLIALIALLVPSVSASGFQHFGVGIKARAMGGAFRATADDWTAAFYNPAGYAYIPDNQIGGNLSVFHLRNELIPNYRWDNRFETGVFNDRVNYNKHEVHNIPAGGFVTRLPLAGETVIGLSSFQAFDNNMTWALYDFLPAYNNVRALPKHEYQADIDVVTFQLTVAKEINEEMSLGIGLEVTRGDMVYNDVSLLANPMATPYSDRPFDYIPRLTSHDATGWGFGFRAGWLWKAGENLSVGISGHVPTSITLTGDVTNDFYMPNLAFNDFSIGEVGHTFTAGEVVTYSSEFEADLSLPASFGIGIAYDVTEKLHVEFDAEYTLWSSFESIDFTYTLQKKVDNAYDSTFSREFFYHDDLSIPTDWENTGKLMLGASYDVNEKLTLLGGGSVDQSPMRAGNIITPLFIDTGDKTSFSFGFLLHLNQYDVGLAQTYVSQPDLTVYSLTDANADGIFDNFPGDFKAEKYETVLSINYRF